MNKSEWDPGAEAIIEVGLFNQEGAQAGKLIARTRIQILHLPGPMPGMNDFIDLAKRQGRRGRKGKMWNSYNEMKTHWESGIVLECLRQEIEPVQGEAYFRFGWIEKNRRRDKDNIVAGRKLILDGLVMAKILAGDGWKHVKGWEDVFAVERIPRVEVWIYG